MGNKKTWTVILSSGAQAPLKKFRLSKLVFYISLSFVFFLFLSIFGLSFFLTELTQEKNELATALEEKTTEVEEIKQDYLALQEETISVQRSIEEFKLFEERISNLKLEMPGEAITSGANGSGGLPYPMQSVKVDNDVSELMEIKEELPELVKKFEESFQRLTEYENELRTIPTIIPTDEGQITSKFGNRKDPFNFKKTFHSGIDIAAPMNTPIFAAADGKITFADRNGGYGLTIIIDHHNTYETLYAHLNEIDVKVGDQVKKGDIIGKMGSTGRSTGVHLHYEIKRNGQHIDPYMFMTFHELNKNQY